MLVIQLSEENVVKDYDGAPSFPLKNLKGAFGRGGGGSEFYEPSKVLQPEAHLKFCIINWLRVSLTLPGWDAISEKLNTPPSGCLNALLIYTLAYKARGTVKVEC